MDAERKPTPLEHAIDLFVHLPVGFLLELPHSVPRCIDRGKQEVEHLSHQATSTLRALGLRPGSADDEPDRHAGTSTAEPPEPPGSPASTTAPERTPDVTAPEASARPTTTDSSDPAVDVDELPIPGYDSLSASQVIPRLDDLNDTELELVRSYEASARGRKTILSRVAQLQDR
jgi:hypothetical protein